MNRIFFASFILILLLLFTQVIACTNSSTYPLKVPMPGTTENPAIVEVKEPIEGKTEVKLTPPLNKKIDHFINTTTDYIKSRPEKETVFAEVKLPPGFNNNLEELLKALKKYFATLPKKYTVSAEVDFTPSLNKKIEDLIETTSNYIISRTEKETVSSEVKLPPELINSLIESLKASEEYYKSQTVSDEKTKPSKFIRLLFSGSSLLYSGVSALAAIFGCWISYIKLKEKPVRRIYAISISSTVFVFALVVFFGSIIKTAMYYVLLQSLLFIITLFVVVYTIKVIFETFPQLKKQLQELFGPELLRGVWNSLEKLNEYQKKEGFNELQLRGSLVDGYEKTIMEIVPKENEISGWKLISKGILQPINIKVKLCTKKKEGKMPQIFNLQRSCAVVGTKKINDEQNKENNDNLEYIKLSDSKEFKIDYDWFRSKYDFRPRATMVDDIFYWKTLLNDIQSETETFPSKLLKSRLNGTQKENINNIDVNKLSDKTQEDNVKKAQEDIVAAFNKNMDAPEFYIDKIHDETFVPSEGVKTKLNDLKGILCGSGGAKETKTDLSNSQKEKIKSLNLDILKQLFPMISKYESQINDLNTLLSEVKKEFSEISTAKK